MTGDNDKIDRIDSSIGLYGWEDDNRPLPFVQLGDVFVRDPQSWVFAVINASCDLQIVPASVSKQRNKKGRIRNRNDTVLLMPGEVCELGSIPPKSLSTELFSIAGRQYAIEWKPKQMLSIPQCCLRAQLQDRGYAHNIRLQMDRAIELQQEAFSSNSRVGLEVQPQLSKSIGLRITAKISGELKVLGDDILGAGAIFHTRRERPVLVLNHGCIVEILTRLESNKHADFADALKQFRECSRDLYRCPFDAERNSQITFKLIKPNNASLSCKNIRIGLSSQPATVEKCDGQLYFHFFHGRSANGD